MDAILHVFTFREGLLGKLGHDLRLTLTNFSVSARGTNISGRFDLASLRVDGAIKDGRLNTQDMSASDKQKVHAHMVEDVLRVREHPFATIEARTMDRKPPFRVQGELNLAGVVRPISFVLADEEGSEARLYGKLELKPSAWGIKPFRAFGGALKVQDRVVITIDARAEWLRVGDVLNPAVELAWVAARPSINVAARPSWPSPNLR